MPVPPTRERPVGAAPEVAAGTSVLLMRTERVPCQRTPDGKWSRTPLDRWHELRIRKHEEWVHHGEGCWTDVEIVHAVRFGLGESGTEKRIGLYPDPNPRQSRRDGTQAHRLRFTYPQEFRRAFAQLPTKGFLHTACAFAFGPRAGHGLPAGAETFMRLACQHFSPANGGKRARTPAGAVLPVLETDHLGDRRGVCDPELCIAGWVELVSPHGNQERTRRAQALARTREAEALVAEQKRQLASLQRRFGGPSPKRRKLQDCVWEEQGHTVIERARQIKELAAGYKKTWRLGWTPQCPHLEYGKSVWEAEECRIYGEDLLAVEAPEEFAMLSPRDKLMELFTVLEEAQAAGRPRS